MKIIFGKRVVSPANVFGIAMVVAYLAVSTLLFTHVSDRLDKALRRVDKLELFITNTIASQDTRIKERTLNWLESVKHEIGMELRGTGEKQILRTRRDDKEAGSNDKVSKLLKRIKRMAARLKKIKQNCKAARKNETKQPRSGHNPKMTGRKKPWVDRKTRQNRPPSPSKCNTTNGANVNMKTHALFTYWGRGKCIAGSLTVQTGQMVTTDGSDYLCLPNKGDDSPYRETSDRSRAIRRSVKIRGVTYGDIEDVMSFVPTPPYVNSTRNNMTVPCAVCSRAGKTASVMLLSKSIANLWKKYDMQKEYIGVLMSTKQSKKFVCVSLSPVSYHTEKRRALVDTVQLHPAELKCDSLHCEASSKYADEHRIQCVVATI